MTTPLLYPEELDVAYEDVITSEEILLRVEIPWDIYSTARLISDQDLQYLRNYDKKEADVKNHLLAESGPLYVAAFLAVLKGVSKDETVQYVLAMLDDMLAGHSERASFFFDSASTTDAYSILLRLLDRNDWFTQEKAALVLATILGHRPSLAGGKQHPNVAKDEEHAVRTITAFLEWLIGQLRRPGHPARGIPTAVHALSVLLRDPSIRIAFYRSSGTPLLAPLVSMPSNGGQLNIQLLYEAALCVWQLSFYKPAAEELASTGVVGGLVDMVRLAQKEKLIRIALLALRNLLSEGAPALEYAVIAKGLPKAVSNRMLQSWDDEDLAPLLEWMQEHLDKGVLALSSINRYRREVMSGSLNWSPLHEQEGFWLEFGESFVENNCQLLKSLLHLLDSSQDPTTLAVACNDVAQFVTYFPHGRGLVSELGGKSMVMRLMAHPSPEVQSQALKCVQRLLLSKSSLEYMHGTDGDA